MKKNLVMRVKHLLRRIVFCVQNGISYGSRLDLPILIVALKMKKEKNKAEVSTIN
jgi:hypothetical protein